MPDRGWETPLGEIEPTERHLVGATYHERYFLRVTGGGWHEVSQDGFVQAERSAGFRPKHGCGPVATGGFGNGTVEGRVESRWPKVKTDA